MVLKIGAHQSIAGGYHEAVSRVANIGGNCLQIFSASPRGFHPAKIDPKEKTDFLQAKEKHRVDPVFFHASYLINLADDGRVGHLSKELLIAELNVAASLGIFGSIVHLGSFKNQKAENPGQGGFDFGHEAVDPKYPVLIKNIKEVLAKTDSRTAFIVENAGNRKIGQSLGELARIFEDVASDRLKLCLDTCHLFSGGYRFDSGEKLQEFYHELEKLKLKERLAVWHVNDSRDEFASGHDRHDNIGEGKIGLPEFRTIVNDVFSRSKPLIIETPGFDQKGPDKKNIDILKGLQNE